MLFGSKLVLYIDKFIFISFINCIV